MQRTSCVVMLLMFLASSGCAKSLLNMQGLQSMMKPAPPEERVVERFRDALREQNEPALRRISSTRFESVALQSEDVLSDLRVMHLPKGELSVVDVQELSETEKLAVVKEEDGGRYQFRLVNDPSKGYWTVDDVTVRRKHKGTQITKSTTEVMGLLATVRSFIDVWETGDQSQILSMTSPRLRTSLEQLPGEWMGTLTKRIASAYEDGMARKPEANMNESDAIVKLPARNGHLLMTIVKESGQWYVDNLEFHDHRDDNRPGSVRRQADAIQTVTSFLKAYQEGNHTQLQFVCDPKFYKPLALANLQLIPLPSGDHAPEEFEIRAYENQLSFLLPSGRQIVRIDLQEQMDEIPEAARNRFMAAKEEKSRFLVQEVTVYEKGSTEQRSLSAVFTAPERATLYLKALQSQDRSTLSYMSTADFSRTVWQRLDDKLVKQLPVPDFYDDGLKLTRTRSVGNRSELEFSNAAGQVFICQMAVEAGILRVADVQFPNEQGLVTSLKSKLQLRAPILEFANAWMTADSEMLERACTTDFNRHVWRHLDGVPSQYPELPFQLRSTDVETRVTQERATMRLKQVNKRDAVVNLLVEHGQWVIDEIQIPQGTNDIVELRRSLRDKITTKILKGDIKGRIVRHSPDADSATVFEPESEMKTAAFTNSFPEPDAEIHADVSSRLGDIEPVNFEASEMPEEAPASEVGSAVYEQPADETVSSGIRFADYARVIEESPAATQPRRSTAVTPLQVKGGQLGLPEETAKPERSKFQLLGGAGRSQAPQAGSAVPANNRTEVQNTGIGIEEVWGPELKQPADFPIPIPN